MQSDSERNIKVSKQLTDLSSQQEGVASVLFWRNKCSASNNLSLFLGMFTIEQLI